MSALEEIRLILAAAAERVGPAVVGIGDHWRRGSGVVFEPGKVLTNAHNIAAEAVAIRFADGRRAEAHVDGADVDGDLAVLSVDTATVGPIAWPRAERPVGVGDPVVALSNPTGDALRVTFGFVSGVERAFQGPRGRRIRGSLEHTAPLAPGASGGPIVSVAGEFLGLNTNRLGDGFYLAIPADADLRKRAEALGRGRTPVRPRLGIAVAPAHVARHLRRSVGLPARDGVLVRDVEAASRAEAAGLEQGDLIVRANGQALTDPDDLLAAIDRLADGVALELVAVRGTDERTVRIGA
ncbi:MAG: hypothetical protein A2X23_00175 [Chloroflexi bacterium GWC2_73_18]|nr:MAG: hypothetical protein A2X23_00175 [Chloroflexi bacterium GWC2_73_18]